MYNNIGNKIKGLAKFICWIGIIVSVIAGICIMVAGSSFFNSLNYEYGSSYVSRTSSVGSIAFGLMIMVLGSIGSWLGSLCLYGFGELVNNSEYLKEIKSKQNSDNN